MPRKKILIIDDDRNIKDIAKKYLQNYGFKNFIFKRLLFKSKKADLNTLFKIKGNLQCIF